MLARLALFHAFWLFISPVRPFDDSIQAGAPVTTLYATRSPSTPVSDIRPAYLILSHHYPERVEQLVSRIFRLSPSSQCVIHHDVIDRELPWGGKPPARVHLIPRTRAVWGDWSLVQATLNLIRYARDSLDATWYVILSGEDLPVVDLEEWESATVGSGIDGIIPARPAVRHASIGRKPNPFERSYVRSEYLWREVPMLRPHNRRHRVLMKPVEILGLRAQPLFAVERALAYRDRWFVGTPRNVSLPTEWGIWWGPQWIAFSQRTANSFLAVHPTITEHFMVSYIPDQCFFHTVAMNIPDLKLVRRLLTYTPRSKAASRHNTLALRTEDLEDIKQKGVAFARKFVPDFDSEIADLVQAEIHESRRRRTQPAEQMSAEVEANGNEDR